jgi:hypothetical protein
VSIPLSPGGTFGAGEHDAGPIFQGCSDEALEAASTVIGGEPMSVAKGRWRMANGGTGPKPTNHLAPGVYRVNRCTARGALVISQLVAPVPTPSGVVKLEISCTVPEGNFYGVTSQRNRAVDPVAVQRQVMYPLFDTQEERRYLGGSDISVLCTSHGC